MLIRQLILGVLIPAVVGGAVVSVAALLRRFERAGLASAVSASAVGLGFLAACVALGWVPLRPVESWHWIAPLAGAGTVAGVIEVAGSRRGWLAWVLRLAVPALAGCLLVPEWQDGRWWWAAGLAVVTLVLTWSLRSVAVRPGKSLVLLTGALLMLVTLGASGVLVQAGIAKFGQLAAALAGAIGGAVALSLALLRPGNLPGAAGMAPVWAVVLTGLLFNGWFHTYSDVPAAAFRLVIVSAAVVGVARTAASGWVSGWRLSLVQAMAALLPLGVALLLAFRGSSSEY